MVTCEKVVVPTRVTLSGQARQLASPSCFGVTKVEHLWDNSTSFLTWTDFQNEYNLKIRFLDYFGIVSAIKSLHKNEVRSILQI